jgi:hypothetical protein
MSANRKLFLVLASTEALIGLSLILLPAVPLALLLGLTGVAIEAIFVSRIAGAALVAIGVVSWMARAEELNPSLFGLLIGVLIYNAAVTILLLYAGIVLRMVGPLLWPTVAFHAVLVVWGCLLLRGNSSGHRPGGKI